MRPRIGLDARFALGERRGIGNYSLELFRAMAALNREFEFVFYSDRKDETALLEDLPNCTIRVLRPGFYPWWEQVLLPLVLQRDGIDLFHATGNTAPIILPRKTKLIITLHDVMYMKDDELLPMSTSCYQRLGRFYRKVVVPPVARKAHHLLTNSEFSKTDICAALPGIRPEKITVTLLALPSTFTRLPPSNTHALPLNGEPYLLHLGGLDPRKNTKRVVQAFLDLKRTDQLREKLIILGLKNLESLQLAPHEITEAATWIHLPGFVLETELPAFYQHATAFLFPSLYEGFGIPLLEAMACGTPIITSNSSSLPEVTGSAAVLIDPLDSDTLKSAILNLLSSRALQSRLHQAGLGQIGKFDWTNTAMVTLDNYKKILTSSTDRIMVDNVSPGRV